MIKLNLAPAIEDAIRKKAAKAGVPLTYYLAPYAEAIAEGRLTMVPNFPPQPQQGNR